MLFEIRHVTIHRYADDAVESHNELRLQPLSDEHQRCEHFRVTTDPQEPVHYFDVPWGRVHHFQARQPHRSLSVAAVSRVRTLLVDPFLDLNLLHDQPDTPPETVRTDHCEWLFPSRRVPFDDETCRRELACLVEEASRIQEYPGVLGFCHATMRLIHREWPYDPSATHVGTTLVELLRQHRRGVCQDFAHLMLGVCRFRGIPARYVSGYLYTGRGLQSGDVMHAWVECLVPTDDHRWVWRGFDPTNNLLAGKSFVKVHLGRDYEDAAPTRGIYSGTPAIGMEVDVKVSLVDPSATTDPSRN